MEKFKKYEDINKPDFRNTIVVVTNTVTGEQRPFDLKDVYDSISSINLSEHVPEDIQSQFNTVKNLYIYTWHCYAFFQIVEIKCFSVLENALRLVVADDDITGLFKLITKAIETGRIGLDYLKTDLRIENVTQADYEEFARSFSSFRNNLAHGSNTLHPYSLSIVYRCALLINHLFEMKAKHPHINSQNNSLKV